MSEPLSGFSTRARNNSPAAHLPDSRWRERLERLIVSIFHFSLQAGMVLSSWGSSRISTYVQRGLRLPAGICGSQIVRDVCKDARFFVELYKRFNPGILSLQPLWDLADRVLRTVQVASFSVAGSQKQHSRLRPPLSMKRSASEGLQPLLAC